MVSETTPMVLAEGHKHTMALDQSALLELLEVLKGADVEDRIRSAATTIYQVLITVLQVCSSYASATSQQSTWNNRARS